MKCLFASVLCIFLMVAFVGCTCDNYDEMLQTGTYYLSGEFKDGLTPYVSLSMEDKSISIGGGTFMSFAADGTFDIEGDTLTASTQVADYVFEIKNSDTLVVVDGGESEFLHMPEKSEFVRYNSTE